MNHLRGRRLIKLLEFSSEEIGYMLGLSAGIKSLKQGRTIE